MTIDWSKPVQTRDGRPVEIITAKGRGDRPIVGYIAESLILSSWLSGGVRYHDGQNGEDLINVPEERELWVRVYSDGYLIAQGNKDFSAYEDDDLFACVHVKYRVGEGLE